MVSIQRCLMGVRESAASDSSTFAPCFGSEVHTGSWSGSKAALQPQLNLSPSLGFHLPAGPWYLKPYCRHFECCIHPHCSRWGGSPISSAGVCQEDSSADENPHRGLKHLPVSEKTGHSSRFEYLTFESMWGESKLASLNSKFKMWQWQVFLTWDLFKAITRRSFEWASPICEASPSRRSLPVLVHTDLKTGVLRLPSQGVRKCQMR